MESAIWGSSSRHGVAALGALCHPVPQQRQLATRPQRTTRAQRSDGSSNPAQPSRGRDTNSKQAPESVEISQAVQDAAEASRLTWQVDDPFDQLSDDHVHMFWNFGAHQHLVPEAFQSYYSEALKRGETIFDRGGCKGLQAELDESEDGRLMLRPQMLQLRRAIEAGTKRRQHFLDGPISGGKSITLAVLAAWGRHTGRIVVYLPSASVLTAGGLYHKDEETGMWHTPDSARLLMATVQGQHREQLSQLAAPNGPGTLDDVITDGIKSTEDNAATEAAVQLLEGLKSQNKAKVLFVVDEWNALYWPTGYFEWQSVHKKYNVLPIELRLCMAVRSLIEGPPPANGSVLVATTRSKGISSKILMPRPGQSRAKLPGTAHFEIPSFNQEETFAWLGHLAANAVVPRPLDVSVMQEWMLAWHLTGGNPVEMRRHLAPLFHTTEAEMIA